MADTRVVISPAGKMIGLDYQAMLQNMLVFTAPVLAVFFGQLAAGVDLKVALALCGLAFYGIVADYFKKKAATKSYVVQKN